MSSHASGEQAAAGAPASSAPWILRTIHVAVAAIVVLAGCAPAYRCYDDCCVPCQCCAPAPLPYSSYCHCQCHSKAAQPYLAASPPALVNPASPQEGQRPPVGRGP